MQKNGIYRGKVTALGTGGEGIIYSEGTTAFVPFCLEGEEVRFKALKVKGNVAYGKAEQILCPSAHRVNAPCPVFGKCGGCDLQHADYAAQLEFKRNLVKNSLEKLGGISVPVEETVACGAQYRYRNKLVLPIAADGAGGIEVGFYAPHSHRIVPITDCLIQREWCSAVIAAVKASFSPREAEFLRHITVRELDGKFIMALVARRAVNLSPLISNLEKSFEDFTLSLNVNPEDTNVIFGKEWHICRGEGFYDAVSDGIKFRAGANTFVQVNDGVRSKLYSRVAEEAGGGDVAIDLYSGGGLLTAILAKKCRAAYGVEIVPEASACAQRLKEDNGLTNMRNVCGAVEEKLKDILQETSSYGRVIVCDPPRKGMQRQVVRAIAESGADKILLISCNPATLARDLGLITGSLKEEDGVLKKSGAGNSPYTVKSVTPFDMFPQTRHVETLAALVKK